jgi:hypothetical protein
MANRLLFKPRWRIGLADINGDTHPDLRGATPGPVRTPSGLE